MILINCDRLIDDFTANKARSYINFLTWPKFKGYGCRASINIFAFVIVSYETNFGGHHLILTFANGLWRLCVVWLVWMKETIIN